MFVIKRSGEKVPMRYDSITDRNIELSRDLSIDVAHLSQLVIQSLKNGMTTNEIDELAAETAAYMSSYEPDYDVLASRIAVSNHQKCTSKSFVETMTTLYNSVNKESGKRLNVINSSFMSFITKNADRIESEIDYSKDFNYSYFGFKTLQRLYLLRIEKKIVERPQHMLMRVACSIHGPNAYEPDGNIELVIQSYKNMSEGYYTHASPTLFNSGSERQQMSSCYLLHIEDDLRHIYETNLRCALISKHGGGIGVDISNVRAKGSIINSTNGASDGLVPMIKVFNSTALYCNQCFTHDTIIYTKNGQKQIKDVTILDEVITNDGTFKPVVNVFVNEVDKEILEIRSTYSFEPVKVTKEHQILAILNQSKSTNYEVILNRLNKKIIRPEYTSADNLTTDDFVGFPLQKVQESDEYQHMGDDFFRFYGIMLGDGHMCFSRNESGVTLNCTSKLDTLMFVREYLNSLGVHYWESSNKNCISVRWTSCDRILRQTVTGITYDDLYNSNGEKRVNPKYLNISTEHRIQLLKGLLETDGSNGKEVYFTTTSYELAHNTRYFLLSLGILSSGYVDKNSVGKTREIRPGEYITNKKVSYDLRISKHPLLSKIIKLKNEGQHVKYFVHDNIIWCRIKKIDKVHHTGKVYDLSILNNNNYLVGSLGLVHNSGKRKGSIAMYLQPWHPDVIEFLALRYNNPPEELRARDIFLALWVNDIFMKRVEEDGVWSFFCPSTVPQLTETYGEEFDNIYIQAERDKKYVKQMKARELWEKILHAQTETGLPYILYKDSINNKSMQSNIGIIRSSNLCAEIVEVTDRDSVAVCNLASLSLPKYVRNVDGRPDFDYGKLYEITKTIVRNIDNVIDINYYPIDESKANNLNYRPMGIGIQGLADVFAMFRAPWGSDVATELNRNIAETIYYAAVEASHELSIERGNYSRFEGSLYSKGILQYHLWNVNPKMNYDWKKLEERVKKGMRNSLLVALMPTASSSQILNNNECFEAFTSNLYSRNTLAGDFIILNKHLVRDLKSINMWNRDIVNRIIENDGSVQSIEEIPRELRDVYKTVWEISQKIVIDYAADRGAFIDQTQSMNIFIDHPTNSKLSSMHMYGWKKGLKTGSYYIRSKAARNAVKFSILKEKKEQSSFQKEQTVTEEKKVGKEYMLKGKKYVCKDEICTACSA